MKKRSLMKKLSALAFALVMACSLAAPAFADVMWEPMGNNFYERHREECEYVGRSYLANGKQGYVTLLEAPESASEVVNVPNGESLYVGQSWAAPDGTKWAVCEYAIPKGDDQGWDWKDGWTAMSGIALIYDWQCFQEDYESEFRPYDGSGDALDEVCLYSYPGGVYSETLKEDKGYQPFAEAFQNLYTDGEGRRWSFLGYYMGRRNAWACLDDPLNQDLGVGTPQTVFQVRGGEGPAPAPDQAEDNVEDNTKLDIILPSGKPTETQLVPPAEDVPPARTIPIWLLPAGLVVLVAAVTAVLAGRRKK